MTNKPKLTKAQREALELLSNNAPKGALISNQTGKKWGYVGVHYGVVDALVAMDYAHRVKFLVFITPAGREALGHD